MTSSNGNIFRVTGPLCGEFTAPGEFPAQRSVTRSFDVFLDLRLNKRLSKQPWGWWFETTAWSLWRHRNVREQLTHLTRGQNGHRVTFSNAFSWMKYFVFWIDFHWRLFPRVQSTIFQHWFRWWLGADQATSHYLNQCWPSSLTHIFGTRGDELKDDSMPIVTLVAWATKMLMVKM